MLAAYTYTPNMRLTFAADIPKNVKVKYENINCHYGLFTL